MNNKTIAFNHVDSILIERTALEQRILDNMGRLSLVDLRRAGNYMEEIGGFNPKTPLLRELNALGKVYHVLFSDFRRTMAVILRYRDIEAIGIDLETLFPAIEGKRYTTRYGVDLLVGLNLYQQIVLLREIIRIRPLLAGRLGFYNLLGSLSACKIFNENGLYSETRSFFHMWTGERNNDQNPNKKEGVLTLEQIELHDAGQYFVRVYSNEYAFLQDPNNNGKDSMVVFAVEY